jgi:aspartate 1-decarboxylase
MQIQVLKSKFIGKSNRADLNYIGSITIDENLLEASNIIEGEKFPL